MAKNALCVGINAYGHGSDLSGCVNDAIDWEAALIARGFAVAKLLDSDAVVANIRLGIKGLIRNAVPGDSLVFTYSGHGTYVPDEDGDEPDGADEAICPVDLWDHGIITDDELYTMYADRPLGIKLFVFSDSCHSGTVSRFAASALPVNAEAPKVKFLPPSMFMSPSELTGMGRGFRRSLPPGRHAGLLLSGCADSEFSWDSFWDGRANGAATYVALKTLATLQSNATYQKWHKEIRRILPSVSYPQSPNLYGSSTMRRWHCLE